MDRTNILETIYGSAVRATGPIGWLGTTTDIIMRERRRMYGGVWTGGAAGRDDYPVEVSK